MNLINPWNCYVAGWGGISLQNPTYVSIELNEVKQKLLDHTVCAQHYRYYNRDCMLCIGEAPGKGPCNGDSGGPFMCPLTSDPNQFLIVGINSIGSTICTQKPTIVTKISHVIDWITLYSSNESLTPPRNPGIFF